MAGRRVKKPCDIAFPPWSDLPSELVSLIFQYLQLPDLLRCRAVCRSWRHMEPHGGPPTQHVPLMIFSLRPNSVSQRFFSVSDRKIQFLTLNERASGAVCCGSFDKWLALSHWRYGDFLLNPFKNSIIRLPKRGDYLVSRGYNKFGGPYGEFQNDPFLFRKVILPKSPHDKSDRSKPCMVAAIFHHSSLVPPSCEKNIAICKLNASWFVYDNLNFAFEDIIFYGEKLLAINHQEAVFKVEVGESRHGRLCIWGIIATDIQPRFIHSYDSDYRKRIYIVQSCINRELLMVLRYLKGENECGSATCFFKIYEIDRKSNPNSCTWREKEDLNGEAIFVSQSGSKAILASEKLGFEGNCIYFLDEIRNQEGLISISQLDDLEVFHMKDGRIEKIVRNRNNSSLSPPAWFFLSNDLRHY
ncbi:hypothetical protein LUZ60_007652 [Juncus effusus]|nr:hypothetical protein LUZ60_007652 [Juncus effusus]